jgi:hypothetical protein
METKKLTQAGRILKQLKEAGSKGVPNYNLGYRGRISDLRKDGHNIHCERQVINGLPTGVWIYYLDDKGESNE